jgi:hypothetical protein
MNSKARRKLVLIDLTDEDVATIRDRLIVIASRERLSYADVAALCGSTRSTVKHLLGAEGRVGDNMLRGLILAFPELAEGLPVEIRSR